MVRKQSGKEEKYRNMALIAFTIAIILFVFEIWNQLPNLSGHPTCGTGAKLLFFPSGLVAIVSTIFTIKSIKEYKKHIALEITLIVLNAVMIIFAILNIVLIKNCPTKWDTERKNDISLLNTAIENYIISNKGNMPSDKEDIDPYLMREDFSEYKIKIVTPTEKTEKQIYNGKLGEIMIYSGNSKCGDTNGEIEPTSNKRNYAIITKLEEKNIYYCLDSN